MLAVRPMLAGVVRRSLGGRFKRAVSESSDEFTLAQEHKRVKVERTSLVAQTSTETAQKKRSGPQPSRLANIAKDWGVDVEWLSTTFGDEILQQAYFVSTLKRWIKAHPTMPAQDALAHFHRRRNIRLSGKVRRQGKAPMHAWTAADLRMDGEDDDDEGDSDDDEATLASTTVPMTMTSVSAALRTSRSARPDTSSQTSPLVASVAAQAHGSESGPNVVHDERRRILERQQRRRMLDSRLENVAKMWKVDMDWLATRFNDDVLHTQSFILTLHKFVTDHPTLSAQNAFEHFQRRRDLRRSRKLGNNKGLNPANLWQAADLRLCAEDETFSPPKTTVQTAPHPVSAPLRSSAAARPSASSPAPVPVAPGDTASMLSKLATAWPSAMTSVSSVQNSIASTPPRRPGQMTTNPSVYSQTTMARNTPSTSLQHTTTPSTPSIEAPMTEAEAAGILYNPMTAGGLDQFKLVQRAVIVLFGKAPPLHIIQIAVGKLRFSKDPNACIDQDPGYSAWMDANL